MKRSFLPAALAVSALAFGAHAQTRQYLQHPHPYTAPVTVPLAPVLDPDYKEKQPYTVETVTVRAAPKPGWDLAEVLKDQPMAASFRDAVIRNGLNQPIDTDRGFTAFVPVTRGKNSSDPVYMTPLDSYSREELSRYITNNRVNIQMIKGTGDRYPALDGSTIRINKIGDSISVNGARVIDSVKTPQGFVYYIKSPFTTSPRGGVSNNH